MGRTGLAWEKGVAAVCRFGQRDIARWGAAVTLANLLMIGACSSQRDVPAPQRGLVGGTAAWITGADRARAEAFEAAAARSEERAETASRGAAQAQRELAFTQGETAAAQSLAHRLPEAVAVLRELARSLEHANNLGAQRLRALTVQEQAFRRGFLPEPTFRLHLQRARDDLDAIEIWRAQGAGVAARLGRAPSRSSAHDAAVRDLQARRNELGATAEALERVIQTIR
jgi:hypothetical protein